MTRVLCRQYIRGHMQLKIPETTPANYRNRDVLPLSVWRVLFALCYCAKRAGIRMFYESVEEEWLNDVKEAAIWYLGQKGGDRSLESRL